MRRYTLARAVIRKNLPISKRRDKLNAVVEGEAVVRFYLRHRQNRIFIGQVFAGLACIGTACALHGQTALQLTVNWDKTMLVSRSVPTLQVVVNPPLRPGEALSAPSYKAVKELGATMFAMCRGCLIQNWGWPNWRPHRAKDQLGLQPDRSDDEGFSLRNGWSSHGDELQHHAGVDVQDRQARDLSADRTR